MRIFNVNHKLAIVISNAMEAFLDWCTGKSLLNYEKNIEVTESWSRKYCVLNFGMNIKNSMYYSWFYVIPFFGRAKTFQ